MSGRGLSDSALLCCYLNVDVVAAVLDDLDVGVVDGLFVVLDAGGPVRGRAKDLKQEAGNPSGSGGVTLPALTPSSGFTLAGDVLHSSGCFWYYKKEVLPHLFRLGGQPGFVGHSEHLSGSRQEKGFQFSL